MEFKIEINFSKHCEDVILTRSIDKNWVFDTLASFSKKEVIADNEVHYFKIILEAEKRCLKVVFNPIKSMVITSYFDRNMRKKGCK
ncbi:MAG: hypothetical protein OIF32_10695 [Campylobacterales bacterium]|nr:hypothetical protein [Campylobacterales bacterium]